MGRRMYNTSYSGLDKKERIDCLAQIRKIQNPPGLCSLCDVDNLCIGPRNTHEDAIKKGEREPGKFVRIGKIPFEENEKESKTSEQLFRESLRVNIQPKTYLKNMSDNKSGIKEKQHDIREL